MISIIIPTYNEENYILKTIEFLYSCPGQVHIKEILVIDGSSSDATEEKVSGTKARFILSPAKGRASQLNYGARVARGELLYFLHADSLPPEDFISHILEQLSKGADSGCFRLKFDDPHWFIGTIAAFTRFNTSFFRFGDQSLFIRKTLFDQIGGYNPACIVMEDHEIIQRIRKQGSFRLMPYNILTSARKFMENGPYKLMFVFLYIYLLYYMRRPQPVLIIRYRQLVRNGKI